MTLDLHADPIALTAALVDIPSPSFAEVDIADAVEAALREQTSLEVHRHGNQVLARTNFGHPTRVILAGHIDTVPIADNVPSHRELVAGIDTLWGCGTVDMKSGDAVFLHLLATVTAPAVDITAIFYDREEVAAAENGLGKLATELPDWLRGDFAILGEPTAGFIEAGCQGSLRVVLSTKGVRAHSARSWLGENAIHKLDGILATLAQYQPRTVEIDGCHYREGLNAVGISGGVAGNVIPDDAEVTINFRFAPDRSIDDAEAHVREVFAAHLAADVTLRIDDAAPGALPGLQAPAAAAFIAAAQADVRAKYGWTDVSRFSALGIPAVNFGPGDPGFAHKRDEQCPTHQITDVAAVLRRFLTGAQA